MRLAALKTSAFALMFIYCLTQLADADLVFPDNYSMPNGGSGDAGNGPVHYWDLYYDGTGDTMSDYAFLSGGLGDLTDGAVAPDNWHNVETSVGDGPYVGWRGFDPNITFEFASPLLLKSTRIHLDDSNGAGAVSPPESITLTAGTFNQTFGVPDPPSGEPFWFEVDLDGLRIIETTFTITLNRRDQWVFASEIEFTGAILGDVNEDGEVNLLDVAPFVELLIDGKYQSEADTNGDGVVNLLDVGPFVDLLSDS